jgi:hypothetical protein
MPADQSKLHYAAMPARRCLHQPADVPTHEPAVHASAMSPGRGAVHEPADMPAFQPDVHLPTVPDHLAELHTVPVRDHVAQLHPAAVPDGAERPAGRGREQRQPECGRDASAHAELHAVADVPTE